MTIQYVLDKELKCIKTVEKGLSQHNKIYTAGMDSGLIRVYILDKGKIQAGLKAYYFWEWLEVEDFFYETDQVLEVLFNEINKHFKGGINATYYKTHHEDRIRAMKAIGFKTQGKLLDRPLGSTTEELVDYTMSHEKMNHDYRVVFVNQDKDPYQEDYHRFMTAYHESIDYDQTVEEVFYLALDGEVVVGGVYGELSNNYLYVSVIWVDEAYRGRKIASKLLNHLEGQAVKSGYKKAFLETASFQAKEFYEKNGYQVTACLRDFPKGYDMYTMVKAL